MAVPSTIDPHTTPWRHRVSQECLDYWDRIRTNLPKVAYVPRPPAVFMECSDDLDRDIKSFIAKREEAIESRKSERKI